MSLTTSKHKRQEDLKSATVSRSETEAADPDSEYLSAHEAAQALRHPVRNTTDRKSTEAMPDQHHFFELLKPYQVRNIVDERVQRDVSGQQVGALAKTSLRGRIHCMTRLAQNRCDIPPTPSAVPRTVHQDKSLRRPALS